MSISSMMGVNVSESCGIYYYERVTTEQRTKGSENARGEKSADSNNLAWAPSEKEEAEVWKEVKPVWVEPTVPPCAAAELSWELRKWDLNVHLW
jgi:hypothetical protein